LILGTSGDKLSADLELDEWEVLTSVSESHSGPASSISMATLWRRSCLAARIAKSRVGYELGAVDLDDKPLKGGVVRKLLAQSPNCLGIGQNGRW